MIACAVLSEQVGDVETGRYYWRLAKAAATEGSPEYKQASSALPGVSRTVILGGAGLLVVISFGVSVFFARRRLSRRS